MAIRFFSEATTFCYKGKRRTARWLERVITDEYRLTAGEVAVIFCTDDYLLQINKQYLHHDYYTDVITFDYSEPPIVSGDVFISIDTVRRNAKRYGATFYEELRRVIVHSILHLCGEDDHTELQQKLMQTAEDRYLKLFLHNSKKHCTFVSDFTLQ
jgi:rRNA maturation RNase YbeY